MINYCMIATGNHFDNNFAARSTTPAVAVTGFRSKNETTRPFKIYIFPGSQPTRRRGQAPALPWVRYKPCSHLFFGGRDGLHRKSGKSLIQRENRRFSARIPHQSKIKDFCQLPPGGSLGRSRASAYYRKLYFFDTLEQRHTIFKYE